MPNNIQFGVTYFLLEHRVRLWYYALYTTKVCNYLELKSFNFPHICFHGKWVPVRFSQAPDECTVCFQHHWHSQTLPPGNLQAVEDPDWSSHCGAEKCADPAAAEPESEQRWWKVIEMESSSSEFACIGLVADNNSWRGSTDSSQRSTGRNPISGGWSKEQCVHIAGGKWMAVQR